ncbi:OmpA/MotB family protein [Butyrivibrio sp. NC2002]|uniref:OmpA/MotB family protein n=1 Tax=Butyrivibrio sp. NC2002 TaxID=1410610 RepID=UPI00056C9386|nr:flagellar motor protein MotB [Butyrivibrio sp. NC2002]
MAKKPEEIKPGLPAWQGTFGDLMNLLLCFFVLLFSMANMDAAKFEEVAASFSSAFGIFNGGENAFGQGALVGDGISQLNQLSNYIISMGISQSGAQMDEVTDSQGEEEGESGGAGVNDEGDSAGSNIGKGEESDSENSAGEGGETEGEAEKTEEEKTKEAQETLEEEQLKASEQLANEIEDTLDEMDITNQVDVNFTSQYVQLTLQGAILFDSGDSTLKEEASPILSKVGAVLERYAGGTIEIEGHTDNVPMHRSGGKYTNNDELSDGRALSVFYYFLENTTLDPSNLKHSGRGEYEPVADNSTPEGRARNRRVEIRIYNPLSAMY